MHVKTALLHHVSHLQLKLVANMLVKAGVDRVLTLDLHAVQVQGFFDIPVDHLMGAPLIADYFERRGMVGSDYVVVSPDHGGVTRARKFGRIFENLYCYH